MVKLIKAEFKKILHKKSFYIVSLIFVLYTILTNIIYKSIDNYEVFNETIDIQEYIEINNNLNLENEEDLEEYVSNLTLIEIEELKKKYPSNNQVYLIDNYLNEIVNESYVAKYIAKNEEEYNLLRETVDNYIAKIASEDWQYFTNIRIANIKDLLLNETDSKAKERYQELIALAEYRLQNNIPYDYDNYLNNAIESLEIDMYEYYNLLDKDKLTKEETERLKYMKENYLRNQYILENKEDINNGTTLQAVLSNFPSEFGLFILIFIIMLSGSIVSEEFNKGTIKYLLTKPYKRSTILTSKLITILLILPIIILFMVLIEIIIGGIILGFDSLNIPIVIYNSTTNTLVNYNIFKYLGLALVASIPMYLILCILCFSLSTLTCSTSAAITVTFLFYLASNIISNIALQYNFKLLKVFISLHWDFTYLINLSSNPFNIKPITSSLVILLYISVMLCIIYIYFNKKDVKNI